MIINDSISVELDKNISKTISVPISENRIKICLPETGQCLYLKNDSQKPSYIEVKGMRNGDPFIRFKKPIRSLRIKLFSCIRTLEYERLCSNNEEGILG